MHINEGNLNGDVRPAMLLTKCYIIQKILGLSNEVLCICVTQGAATQQEVRI